MVPASQKIADRIYYIPAKGHTNGNSIVVVEDDGLFYMIHGDVTYTDEALYENKLSIVFEDLAAARATLDYGETVVLIVSSVRDVIIVEEAVSKESIRIILMGKKKSVKSMLNTVLRL